jgi:CRISPR-associated protein Cst2
LYAYTITIDLDKVGIDKDIEISNAEKAERVVKLLETIEFLWRDIKGRRENMNPVFAVGGIYERKNPYFEDRLKIKNEKLELDVDLINSIINSCSDTKENTITGSLGGIFTNDEYIKERLNPVSVNEMFTKLTEKVRAYYA